MVRTLAAITQLYLLRDHRVEAQLKKYQFKKMKMAQLELHLEIPLVDLLEVVAAEELEIFNYYPYFHQ